jgi:hypothetical protein
MLTIAMNRSSLAKLRIWIGTRCVDLVMVVLLLAGVGKLLDITMFQFSLAQWRFVPNVLTFPLALTIACAEVLTGFLWLARVSRRPALQIATVMMMVFTGAYGFGVMLVKPPDCRCFGILERYRVHAEEARTVVVRNALLIALLLAGHVLLRREFAHGKAR